MIGLDLRCVAAIGRVQFLEFRRDYGSVFLSIVFPLFFVVILIGGSLTAPSFRPEFGLVNPTASQASKDFAMALGSAGIGIKSIDRDEALPLLRKGRVSAVIVFPDGDLRRGGQHMGLIADEKFRDYAVSMMEAARSRLLLRSGEPGQAFSYDVEVPPAAKGSQFAFIYPGLLALALVQIGVFLTATPLLKAREKGTLRYLLLTPLTVPELIAGQVVFRLAVAFGQILLLLLAGSLIVDLSAWQWLSIFAVSALGTVMFVAAGYALAGIPNSVEAGMSLVMIVNFTMMFGGNIFWDPANSLSLKIFAHLIPASYLADLYRQVINRTPGLWPMWLDVAAMASFTVAALMIAARTFTLDTRSEHRRANAPVEAA